VAPKTKDRYFENATSSTRPIRPEKKYMRAMAATGSERREGDTGEGDTGEEDSSEEGTKLAYHS
jgi:hypothetical protein